MPRRNRRRARPDHRLRRALPPGALARRHGGEQRGARQRGRCAHPRRRRQRGRCGGGHGLRARGDLSAGRQHRRRRLHAGAPEQGRQNGRDRLPRSGAARRAPRHVPRQDRRGGATALAADAPRLGRARLGRGAAARAGALRTPRSRHGHGAGDRARRERIPRQLHAVEHAHEPLGTAAARQPGGEIVPVQARRLRVPARRDPAPARSRVDAAPDRGARHSGFLRRPGGRSPGRRDGARRRPDHAARPEAIPGAGARTGARQFPRLRDRLDAAALLRRRAPGADAERAGAVSAARSAAEQRGLHPRARGNHEARLRGPQQAPRRSRLSPHTRRRADLAGLREADPRCHRSAARHALGADPARDASSRARARRPRTIR